MPNKLLIIKQDALGDGLLFTSVLQLWLQENKEDSITLLSNDFNGRVFNPSANLRLIQYPKSKDKNRQKKGLSWRAIIKQRWIEWRLHNQFDYLIRADSFSTKAKTLKRLKRFGCQRIISFCEPQDFALISDPVTRPPEKKGHEIFRLMSLFKALDLKLEPTQAIPFPHFQPNTSMREATQQWLSDNQLQSPFIILGTNGSKESAKPSAAQLLLLARYFWEKYQLKTVLLWKPGMDNFGDDLRVAPVLQAKRDYIIPCRGSIDLNLGLIFKAAFSVLPDGGLMHFAAIAPGGVLGLFANEQDNPSPKQWAPYGPKSHFMLHPESTENWTHEAFLSSAENAYLAEERQPLNSKALQQFANGELP